MDKQEPVNLYNCKWSSEWTIEDYTKRIDMLNHLRGLVHYERWFPYRSNIVRLKMFKALDSAVINLRRRRRKMIDSQE